MSAIPRGQEAGPIFHTLLDPPLPSDLLQGRGRVRAAALLDGRSHSSEGQLLCPLSQVCPASRGGIWGVRSSESRGLGVPALPPARG